MRKQKSARFVAWKISKNKRIVHIVKKEGHREQISAADVGNS